MAQEDLREQGFEDNPEKWISIRAEDARAVETRKSAPARVRITVEAPPGSDVEVKVREPGGALVERKIYHVAHTEGFNRPALQVAALLPRIRLSAWTSWLVGAALVIYALTRLIALDSFPIYFFTDEAVQTVLAADFLRDHLQNYDHEIFPTYFKNGPQYNLSASVYLQVIPYLLFGKSIWVTRGASAIATLAAALALALAMKHIFHSAYPWLAVLFLAITPAWFLHSRTAFETALATTFYALFLYFYLMYRCRDPRYLFGALVMAALAFYTYSPTRLVVAVSGLLLLFTDLKYHLQHWRYGLVGMGVLALLALPFARFWVNHPLENSFSMRLVGSYWVSDMPLAQKIGTYAGKYLEGLDPLYWYLPNSLDLSRHTMLNYGQLLRQTLPLGLLGVGLALYRIRKPEQRILLIGVLSAPAGAALVEPGITRMLTMVIPMALLTALATEWLMERAAKRWQRLRPALVAGVFLLLSGTSVYMLYDALANGPTWYSDYSMAGMQYGAKQLFSDIRAYLRQNPGAKLVVSPAWSNGTDVVARFFFDDPLPFTMGNADSYYKEVKDLDPSTEFVLIPQEFKAIPRELFSEVRVDRTLAYPNGLTGFYYVHLTYAPDAGSTLAAEMQARQKLVEEQIELLGQTVTVRHTQPDIGKLADLFDGDTGTLFRTDGINPLKVQILFPQPVKLSRVTLVVGGVATTATVQYWEGQASAPVTVRREAGEASNPRSMTLDLGGERLVSELDIEVRNTHDNAQANVHLWEILLK